MRAEYYGRRPRRERRTKSSSSSSRAASSDGQASAASIGGGSKKEVVPARYGRRREESCSSDGTGCLLAGLRALSGGWWCGSSEEGGREEAEVREPGSPRSRGLVAPLKRTPDFHVASATPFEVDDSGAAARGEGRREHPATPRRRIMSPVKLAEAASSYDGTVPNGFIEAATNGHRYVQYARDPKRRSILKRHEHDNDPFFLRKSHSQSSLESEGTDFEECEASARRAESQQRRVTFALDTNEEHEITSLGDMSWRTRRDCYWQPEEYAAMSQSRLWLERAVLQTGGRVKIEGESRRGLGLVCEPETRIARASKIQQTQRAVLRMHHEGASAARLAKFAADASGWATRNALICAQKDLQAAVEPELPHSPAPVFAADIPPPAAHIPRCDSNTAETNGLASMIRNDSLGNLHNNDTLAAYARARRRIPPIATGSSNVPAVSA